MKQTHLRNLPDDEMRIVLEAVLEALDLSFEIIRTDEGNIAWVDVTRDN